MFFLCRSGLLHVFSFWALVLPPYSFLCTHGVHLFLAIFVLGLPVHLFSFFFFSKLCCFRFRSSSSVFVLCLVVIFWPLAGLAVVVSAVLFSGGCGDSRCGSSGLCGPGFAVVRFDGVMVMAGGADVVVGYWC
jgi:hypothetical protein